MTPRASLGSYRRLFLSVAVITFTMGIMGASYSLGERDLPGTRAGVLFVQSVDLEVDGRGSTGAFFGNPNFAPGDVSRGEVTLYTTTGDSHELYDLDFDVKNEVQGFRAGSLRLTDALVVTKLRYGSDDLLSGADGGRDLLREIDRNPLLGNGDGRLSLRELEAGVNDLPPPLPRPHGTSLQIDVRIGHPDIPLERYDTLSGQTGKITFTWYLAHAQESDLN